MRVHPNPETDGTLTIKINTKPVRFPGKEGLLMDFLLKAQEVAIATGKNEISYKHNLETAVWGEQLSKGKSDLTILIGRVNRRVMGLVVRSTYEAGGWYLTRSMSIERSKRSLPAPKRGWSAQTKEPDLVLAIDGWPNQNFYKRRAEVLRYLFRERLAFRSPNEIALAMGLDPTDRTHIYRLVGELRDQVENLFETGPWGRGWRLNPRVRMYVVYDKHDEEDIAEADETGEGLDAIPSES